MNYKSYMDFIRVSMQIPSKFLDIEKITFIQGGKRCLKLGTFYIIQQKCMSVE